MKSGLTTKDVCSVEDCNNVVMTRGRCKKHYQRPIKTIPCSVSHCKNAKFLSDHIVTIPLSPLIDVNDIKKYSFIAVL